MTEAPAPEEFPELLQQMRKLTELVDPLKAIIAAEKKPDLTERIERFLSEVTRIGDKVERAAKAMEEDQESRAALKRMEGQIEDQGRELKEIGSQMRDILRLFGAPPDDPEQI